MLNRRKCSIMAAVLVIYVCAGFVFPALRIHKHILGKKEHKSIQPRFTEHYTPPRATLIMLGILCLTMAFDFSFIMGIMLRSPRMTKVWIYGSAVRIVVWLACGIFLLITREDHVPMGQGIAEGIYFIVGAALAALAVMVAVEYKAELQQSQEAQEQKERLRQMEDVERLRMAAAAATFARHRDSAALSASSGDSLQSDAGAGAGAGGGDRMMYVRAAPEQHSYAYRHHRDRTYYAPKIAY